MNSLYKKGLSLVQQLINIEKNPSYEDNFFFFSGLSSFSNTSANESTSKEDTTDN